jgi:predicted DNA-binding transcriptional regulator YafY
MDAIIDKFGEAVDTGLIDEKTFSVTVETAVNHIFYSWVFGFGGKVKILEPRDVVEGYADMVLHAANTLVSEM